MTRAILLDIDGTLIDSVDFHAIAYRRAFLEFGKDFPVESFRAQIGKGSDHLLPVFLSEEEVDSVGKAISQRKKAIFRADYLDRIKPFPGSRELVERILAAGKQVAIASSAGEDEIEDFKRIARVDDLIKTHSSSDDAERSKPEPDIFQAAIGRLDGVDPSEAVAVGDTPYDAEAATKAGIRPVGVLCGGFPEADLRASGCVAIYRDPRDLLDHFDESPLA